MQEIVFTFFYFFLSQQVLCKMLISLLAKPSTSNVTVIRYVITSNQILSTFSELYYFEFNYQIQAIHKKRSFMMTKETYFSAKHKSYKNLLKYICKSYVKSIAHKYHSERDSIVFLHCAHYRNLLLLLFGKNFVKVTFLSKWLLNSWFDKKNFE